MSVDNWISVVAVVVALGGVLLAARANRAAKKANELVAETNAHAADAVREAKDANRIAEHANELSERTHLVVEREAAQRAEQHIVEWGIQWHERLSQFIVVNHGTDEAHRVAVVTRSPHFRKTSEFPSVKPGIENAVVVPVPEVAQRRHKERMPQREADGRLVFVSTPYAERLSVLITHETALRQKRDQVFELTAS